MLKDEGEEKKPLQVRRSSDLSTGLPSMKEIGKEGVSRQIWAQAAY